MHVHVILGAGEAKFWLESEFDLPTIILIKQFEVSNRD